LDLRVGINRLREGLDMPEVALVGILDADKEGFLRSDRSLIQTIGRDARNVNGRAILYADKITGSMKRAMDETERRRKKQLEFNEQHNIQPKGIQKKIVDILDAIYSTKSKSKTKLKVADVRKTFDVDASDEKSLWALVEKLETEMRNAAKDLEFERAADLRDQIVELKRRL